MNATGFRAATNMFVCAAAAVLLSAVPLAAEPAVPKPAATDSAERLLQLAADARADPAPLDCCDWGGSCLPHKATEPSG